MVSPRTLAREQTKVFDLQDGTSVVGQVVSEGETHYVVRTNDGTRVEIPIDRIVDVRVLERQGPALQAVAAPTSTGHLLIGSISLDLNGYQGETAVQRGGLEVKVEGSGDTFWLRTDAAGYFHRANVPPASYAVEAIRKPGAWTIEPSFRMPVGTGESRLIDLGPLDMLVQSDGRLRVEVSKRGSLRGFARRYDLSEWAAPLGAVNSVLVSEAFVYDAGRRPPGIDNYQVVRDRERYVRREFTADSAPDVAVIFVTHNLDPYVSRLVHYACEVERDGEVILSRSKYRPEDYTWEPRPGMYAPMHHDRHKGGCIPDRLDRLGSYSVTLFLEGRKVSSVEFSIEAGAADPIGTTPEPRSTPRTFTE